MKSKKTKKIKFEPIKEVGIVRDRGQLTIPSEIRQVNKWVAKDTPVNMYAIDSETIVIKPVASSKSQQKLDKKVFKLNKRDKKSSK